MQCPAKFTFAFLCFWKYPFFLLHNYLKLSIFWWNSRYKFVLKHSFCFNLCSFMLLIGWYRRFTENYATSQNITPETSFHVIIFKGLPFFIKSHSITYTFWPLINLMESQFKSPYLAPIFALHYLIQYGSCHLFYYKDKSLLS